MRLRPAELSAEFARFAGLPEGPSFETEARFNEGVDQSEAAICLRINRGFINRGCIGKGHIRRNKTIAFKLSRKNKRRNRDAPPLSVPSGTSLEILRHTSADLEQTIHHIVSVRHGGVATEEELLGFLASG